MSVVLPLIFYVFLAAVDQNGTHFDRAFEFMFEMFNGSFFFFEKFTAQNERKKEE